MFDLLPKNLLMKRIITLSLIAGISMSGFAQNSTNEQISSQYLQLPAFDLQQNNPTASKFVYASNKIKFGTPEKLTSKTLCLPKDGGLKDLVEVNTFYYNIPIENHEAYVAVVNEQGETVYVESVAVENEPVEFGKKECKYWIDITLKKDFEAQKEIFFKTAQEDLIFLSKERAQKIILEKTFPSFVKERFKLYSAKGKSFEYEDLETAAKKARSAYEGIFTNGFNQTAYNDLLSAIGIWEKALEELNENDKKARINKSIAKGLYENLGRAYSYTYQDMKAIQAYEKSIQLWGGFSNNRRIEVEKELQVIKDRKWANAKNKAAISDVSKLVALSNLAKSNPIIVLENEKSIDDLSEAHQNFQKQQESVLIANEVEIAREQISDNPYEKMVISSVSQGKVLNLNPMSLMMLDIKTDDFPTEICLLTDLGSLNAPRMDFKTIPAEIANLEQLSNLNLASNKISHIPAEIGGLKQLKKLNLSNNPIESFSTDIQQLENLKKLNLKGSKLNKKQQQELTQLLPNTKIKF